MSTTERVTITLPRDLLAEIDRIETNRSRFVLEAVRWELDRRRREELRTSLATPHQEAEEVAEDGFADWARGLPEEDATGLVDPRAGTAVRWRPGTGWEEAGE